jgi:glycerophosphoryl diester phosphodiesterase
MQIVTMSVVGILLTIGMCHTNVAQAESPIPVAHRGLLRHAPENTLPAFATCLELGMGFELDIRTTKDGHLVVLHDDNVERTTNGRSRSVRDMTLKEVRQLDAGSWFDLAFTGVRVPTLEETFALVRRLLPSTSSKWRLTVKRSSCHLWKAMVCFNSHLPSIRTLKSVGV